MTKKKSLTDKQTDALLDMGREEGYRHMRVIDGMLCAVHPQAYTFGLIVNIEDMGYERRYCYEKLSDALSALETYQHPKNTHAPGPWIKVKGSFVNMRVDDLNPAVFAPDAVTGLPQRRQEAPPPPTKPVTLHDVIRGSTVVEFEKALTKEPPRKVA